MVVVATAPAPILLDTFGTVRLVCPCNSPNFVHCPFRYRSPYRKSAPVTCRGHRQKLTHYTITEDAFVRDRYLDSYKTRQRYSLQGFYFSFTRNKHSSLWTQSESKTKTRSTYFKPQGLQVEYEYCKGATCIDYNWSISYVKFCHGCQLN